MIIYEKTDYGLYFKFSGIIKLSEITEWKEWIVTTVADLDDGYAVFVDMREIDIMPAECKAEVEAVQKFCVSHNFSRSVIVLNDPMTAMQFKLIAKKTGVYEHERYVDASTCEDWEKKAMDWLLHAVDPDAEIKSTEPIKK